ncbi:MAG: bifunctional folylpolyglutamate synthase/dihydrofolate synthase [Flavobacteriaceae bacterium]|nr:bifunctional folylpolyglutamate synthase/dihydrofolate synthase [Flavobacteriaceae bacterium]
MKTYQETLDWMFSRLPMYQRVGAAAYKLGLEGMLDLDAYLKHPHQSFRCIHVAGTNGKGSTSHAIASVLQNAGYKVGLYTSPHLLDFRERIRINGAKIPETEVIEFIIQHREYFEEHGVSFFEMTVGLAFTYFNSADVDFALIEVGLGGRLDATNIIHPELSVITNIGLDHTEFLGETRSKIANEKAGIIKHRVPVVVGQKDSETQAVFETVAQRNEAPLFFTEPQQNTFKTDLKGIYQNQNIQTAHTALRHLENLNLDDEIIKGGFEKIIQNTGLQGRWQLVSEKPQIILDVGHNKEGISLIVNQLGGLKFKKLHLVLGFVQGKNAKELISLFPADTTFYLCSPKLKRALPLSDLQRQLGESNFIIEYFNSVSDAFHHARSNTEEDDLVLVCGSTFVVAEVLEVLNDEKT